MRPERAPIEDVRLRVIALLLIAFCFSTVQSLVSLAMMVAFSLFSVWAFRVQFRDLGRRLRVPGLVVSGLIVVLPLASGETVLLALGPAELHAEGLESAIEISVRFICIVAVATALLSSVPISKLVSALRALGLPGLMADMALLTLRHVEDLRDDLKRMHTAMRQRGAPSGFWKKQFRATGWALASLLLRSHARSEQIYYALILRGHGTKGVAPMEFNTTRSDLVAMAVLTIGVAFLLALEHLT